MNARTDPQQRQREASRAPEADFRTPADRYQELFVAVQRERVFADSKTFVDCAPRAERDLRAAAESGWDFSSRWFQEPAQPGAPAALASIRTTSLLPVDLNALLHRLECTIARLSREAGAGPSGRHGVASAALASIIWCKCTCPNTGPGIAARRCRTFCP